MKTKLIKILTPFTVLPLLACGQTPVSNANAESAVKAESAGKSVAASLKARLEKTYSAQDLKVLSVSETPVKGITKSSSAAGRLSTPMPKAAICSSANSSTSTRAKT